MDQREYWEEVKSIARDVLEETCKDNPDEDEDSMRELLEERLTETVDGHQWVIYKGYHFEILNHSENDGYMIENFGSDGLLTETRALNTTALAFWALYADASEALWEAFEGSLEG